MSQHDDRADEVDAPRPELDETPPVLGSWRNIYFLVIGTLVVLMGLFWLLTEVYS